MDVPSKLIEKAEGLTGVAYKVTGLTFFDVIL